MLKKKAVAEIIDNLRRVFQVVNEFSKIAEKDTGLTGPQLWAIKVIADSAPIRVSALARRMYLHPTTVVGILDRLERRDLVFRTRSTEDRRVVEVDLTTQGKQLVEEAPEVAQGLLVKGLEVMPSSRLKYIADALDDLVRFLEQKKCPHDSFFLQRLTSLRLSKPRAALSNEITLLLTGRRPA